jgi:glutaredoxin
MKTSLVVWTMDNCIWCDKVKQLLADNDMPFVVVNQPLEEMKVLLRVAGLDTLPQVWFGDHLIGGYDKTKQWLENMP